MALKQTMLSGATRPAASPVAPTDDVDVDDDRPAKKAKVVREQIAIAFDEMETVVSENFSQCAWAKPALEKLADAKHRPTGSALSKIVKSALLAANTALTRKEKQCTKLQEKVQALESRLSKKAAAADAPSKLATAKRAAEIASHSIKDEKPIVVIEDVSFVKPWGKFTVTVFPSAIQLSNKKGETYSVLVGNIDSVIHVAIPTTKDEVVTLPLSHALTVGKTQHDTLVMKFKPGDELGESVLKSIKDPFKEYTVQDLKEMLTDSPASVATASLVSAVTARDTIERCNENLFKSSGGGDRTCITCHCKAQHGVLIPLPGGFLFGLKPLLWLPKSQIQRVEFIRASRYFELIVVMKGTGTSHSFEMIDIEEEPGLARYCALQRFGEEERGGKAEAAAGSDDETDDEGPVRARDEDDYDEEDDSDYCVHSDSSVPEDYDSDIEEDEETDDDEEEDDDVEVDEDESDASGEDADDEDKGSSSARASSGRGHELSGFAVVADESDTE
ncbi:unnamed protein product (mitochondrion) [Plasmodiophora brassicae]|uniref:FACT complex subunit SSRP1 n=2 Tax=Plasmodiophora brassicae TaxID=37360 RepID=A0A3P3YAP2_PLABS|nr:unnamed protein product [Plasmodiophora brassicae]